MNVLLFGATGMVGQGVLREWGHIQPLDGVQSRTRWYRILYAAVAPLYPVLKRLFPGAVTTAQVGRAMVEVARVRPGRARDP